MLDSRVELSLAPVIARWASADTKALLPLFLEVLQGRVPELFGVSLAPTLHRIEIGEKTLFSCCALVAHTVATILEQDATIISTDPVSGEDIRIRVSANLELQDADPTASYGTLVDGEAGELLEDPRTKFCCHVKHFMDEASAIEFCRAYPGRYPVPIQEFHKAAQQLFGRIWRRPAIETEE